MQTQSCVLSQKHFHGKGWPCWGAGGFLLSVPLCRPGRWKERLLTTLVPLLLLCNQQSKSRSALRPGGGRTDTTRKACSTSTSTSASRTPSGQEFRIRLYGRIIGPEQPHSECTGWKPMIGAFGWAGEAGGNDHERLKRGPDAVIGLHSAQ
jgi:hypothetical protein